MTMITDISVLIPARNEEANVQTIIPLILDKYNQYIQEVIIIDDCSTDKTSEVVKKLQVKYPKVKLCHRNFSPGVGLALREGIKHISQHAKYVMFLDCDFIINISDIENFIQQINDYDGVNGSRFIKKNSLNNYPLIKLFANRSFHFLAKILIGVKNSDLTNNFRLYRRELVERIYPMLKSRDFAINAEIGFYPILLGARIGEIPVHWHERSEHMGLSKFKILRVGPSYFQIFLKLLFMKGKMWLINLPFIKSY